MDQGIKFRLSKTKKDTYPGTGIGAFILFLESDWYTDLYSKKHKRCRIANVKVCLKHPEFVKKNDIAECNGNTYKVISEPGYTFWRMIRRIVTFGHYKYPDYHTMKPVKDYSPKNKE